jgi:hypothetical protein
MRRWLLLALVLAPLGAYAGTYEDVLAMLDKPDTKPVDVVAAINASTDKWLPHHVYALIDRHAPREVIGAVAAKAAVFYDGSQLSLDDQGAATRAAVPPEVVPVHSADDLVMIFEFFNDVKNEIDAAKASAGPKPTQNAGEMEAVFDKRARAFDESVVAAIAPSEGKIDATTWAVELPAALGAPDAKGCQKVELLADLPSVGYLLFRTAMGGNLVLYDVTFPKPITVEKLQWGGENSRRLQGTSWPICDPTALATLSSGVKFKGTLHRTHLGGDWTGTGEFVDKTGVNIPAKKPK